MTSTSPALLFRRLRWQLLCNSLRLVRERSVLRIVTVLVCSLVIWGLLFGVSWKGFFELRVRWDVMLSGKLLATVFDFMFLALTIMLTFSTAIILYSSLFLSRALNAPYTSIVTIVTCLPIIYTYSMS